MCAGRGAVIDTPKRCHQQIRFVDEMVRLPGYEGEIRQLAVDGLGREQPTLFVSNNLAETARSLIIRYAGRNAVEDGLGTSVNFFHLDCLASEVRLNVDLNATLTVLANGCYRRLARQLHGFDKTVPKKVYRKFVETGGQVEVQSNPTASWCGSTNGAITRSCVRRNWTRAALRSHGSVIDRWSSFPPNILRQPSHCR